MVLSGSMEPAFYRGDILFLYMGKKPFSTGEVVVFNINGRDIPIVHRIIKVHETLPGSKEDDVRILTKVRSCSALQQDTLRRTYDDAAAHNAILLCMRGTSAHCTGR